MQQLLQKKTYMPLIFFVIKIVLSSGFIRHIYLNRLLVYKGGV